MKNVLGNNGLKSSHCSKVCKVVNGYLFIEFAHYKTFDAVKTKAQTNYYATRHTEAVTT